MIVHNFAIKCDKNTETKYYIRKFTRAKNILNNYKEKSLYLKKK